MVACGVTLEPVAEIDKATLANLIQLHRHDLSEFRGYELSEHGTFVYRYLDHYWLEPGRDAFFIRASGSDGALAGFALSRSTGEHEPEREVAEFFVARAHRRHGVGRAAALALFARLPGAWTVFHDAANGQAAAFWRAVIAEASGGSFSVEEVTTPSGLAGLRYRFTHPPT